jgi:viroplasmin and RNaseH domain-containing protein
LETNFPFQGEAGIGDSPTFKTLKATGLTADSMDPATVLMMLMVDQLTTLMAQLASKVEGFASESTNTAPATQPPQKQKEKQPETATAAQEAKDTKAKYFYGVGHGRDGSYGVYTSWGEAGPLVVGVSKAIFQRFSNRREAQDFVDATQALRQQQTANQPSGTLALDVWYTVTNSKTGHYNIFPSWPAAQIHVVNVSGASVRKFRMYSEAQVYIEGHSAAWEAHRPAILSTPREEPHGNHKFSHKQTIENHQLPAVVTSVCPVPNATPTSSGPLVLYPPGMLMGADPSTGKSEELFGVDIEVSEEELYDALCPPDLSESMARSLINGTIADVALPGGLNSGGELEGTSSDVGILGEALEELVTQNRGTAGNTGRSDLRWRSEKRTSLQGMMSEVKLRTRIKHIKKLIPKVQKRMDALTSTSCKRSGWSDTVRIHTWC